MKNSRYLVITNKGEKWLNSVFVDIYLNFNNKIGTTHYLPGYIYNKYYRLMRAHMIYPITLSINIKRVPNET